MGTFTQSEIADITHDMNFWKMFEHDAWRLLSFTDRKSARFGWNCGGQYTKYVTIEGPVVTFLLGVDPDVLDQL